MVFLNSDVANYINDAMLPVDGGFMAGVASGQIESGIVRSKGRK